MNQRIHKALAIAAAGFVLIMAVIGMATTVDWLMGGQPLNSTGEIECTIEPGGQGGEEMQEPPIRTPDVQV
ncbi:hypothetical protein EYC98_21475 [Halieaceae bacterium IMCC14734]|uniref:Uncharacterized protein n=1 Tax=Candidatus Litorirhabdus singularis TaxID=2518993 RepID=A0ABT3TM76_9GAMM|nr:hypothetical protein [Candidatus Litorirhabdus singularis]MCX2983439.1 hypothetical protein [Candidatus Litorirhabdus singularis]